MFGMEKLNKPLYVGISFALATVNLVLPASAGTLQSGIEKDDSIMRLSRPDTTPGGSFSSNAPLRIERPMAAPPMAPPIRGLVDTGAFNTLKGTANQDDPKLGLLRPAEFGSIPNSKFDLGADRNSRELTLAW